MIAAIQTQLIKKMALWLGLFLGVTALISGLVKLATTPTKTTPSAKVTAAVLGDWTKGSQNPKVVLIEYSDFQCPACAHYYPIVKRLDSEFANDLQFVYRHFPLPSHNNAKLAAYAVEAAGKQGKFWEMHDLVFENQSAWSNKANAKETFIQYAQKLELDVDRFKSDLNSKEVKDKVENDLESGRQALVNATPTFFLNGQKITNPKSYEEFVNIVQGEIAKIP